MMFRIRQIYDDLIPVDRAVITQVQNILSAQFPLLAKDEIVKLPESLRNPLKFRFRPIIIVAEGSKGTVKGFALLLHAPDLNFCYLDFLSTAPKLTGRGLGGILYERVREHASTLGVMGIFFECLPDDPKLSPVPETQKINASRLRFYERYGARPISNTLYETPVKPGDTDPPYLVFDGLDRTKALRREVAKIVVRAILERKYASLCPKDYVNRIVGSFKDDPVKLREYKYIKNPAPIPVSNNISRERRICLVVNEKHTIHHIHDRGYVESPVRIDTILKEIEPTGLFEKISAQKFPERYIREIHHSGYVDYFKRVCQTLKPGQSVYPYVFPIRNAARPPKELSVRAGYYCIDTFTPINSNAFLAASGAVDCALTAATSILKGLRLAYALVRPPGHHAERRSFGGFCYFNSTAIGAQLLSAHGKVAVLDIDYHHGNGQQDIFFERPDVLTVSIHGHPHIAYPYFSGFTSENGTGSGRGYNVNFPLPEQVDGKTYRAYLERALKIIIRFNPTFLVVALGLDTSKGDPTGTWTLTSKDFTENGTLIGALRLPTLVIQEGGYRNRVLGINARHFFMGLWNGMHKL